MRFILRAMCAVALAGCADVKTPVETKTSTLSPTDPTTSSPIHAQPHDGVDPQTLSDRVEALFGDHLAKVDIPVDGFSQFSDAVHPDMTCAPASWNGAQCWLMYTPYKNSDPSNENPAVLFASSDTTWTTPAQVVNPVVPYPGIASYNSDPDHAYDPTTHRLVEVYRVVTDSFNKVMIMSTENARQWTPPTLAFKERNHDAVSPALILEPDRTAKIWYVQTGAAGCSATESAVKLRTAKPDSDSRYERSAWSAPTPVAMSIPGYVIWHLDVIEMPNGRGYVAMIAAFQHYSNCGASDVWLATSADGVTWTTYAMPIFWRTMKLAQSLNLLTWYRGTLRYNPLTDMLDLWPSGMSRAAWSVYHAQVNMTSLMTLLTAAQPSDFHAPALSRVPLFAKLDMP